MICIRCRGCWSWAIFVSRRCRCNISRWCSHIRDRKFLDSLIFACWNRLGNLHFSEVTLLLYQFKFIRQFFYSSFYRHIRSSLAFVSSLYKAHLDTQVPDAPSLPLQYLVAARRTQLGKLHLRTGIASSVSHAARTEKLLHILGTWTWSSSVNSAHIFPTYWWLLGQLHSFLDILSSWLATLLCIFPRRKLSHTQHTSPAPSPPPHISDTKSLAWKVALPRFLRSNAVWGTYPLQNQGLAWTSENHHVFKMVLNIQI